MHFVYYFQLKHWIIHKLMVAFYIRQTNKIEWEIPTSSKRVCYPKCSVKRALSVVAFNFYSVVSHSFAIENEHNFLCAFFSLLYSLHLLNSLIRLFSFFRVFGCCSFTVTQQHSIRGINEIQLRLYLRLLAAWLCAIKTA